MNSYPIRTVLFATDFSEASRLAGRRAAAMARHYSARLHVVHVDPPVTAPASPSLLGAAASARGTGVDVTVAALSGLPARQICSHARRIGADVIVVGTHGRTGLSRALLGSVAEAVVRHAPCAVMTVPATDPAVPTADTDLAAHVDSHCVVCAKASPDLICEPCRAIIRGEALERRRVEEHAARVAS
jgi:nucleotide-binding universal stress UspA family protein